MIGQVDKGGSLREIKDKNTARHIECTASTLVKKKARLVKWLLKEKKTHDKETKIRKSGFCYLQVPNLIIYSH